MKKIVTLCVLGALAYGDEIERIDALVKDIASLRSGYEQCMKELSICKSHTKDSSVEIINQ